MNRKLILENIIWFVLLVLFQVLVLNNVRLGGYINPFLYVLFIIRMPSNLSGWVVLCLSFLLGFSVDVFSTEMGFHTFASTLAGFSRIYLFNIFFSKHEQESIFSPSLQTVNTGTFILYALLIVSIHSFCYFILEIFVWEEIPETLLRASLSGITTLLLILFVEFLLKLIKKK